MSLLFSVSKVMIVVVFVALSIFTDNPSVRGITAGLALIESLIIFEYEQKSRR